MLEINASNFRYDEAKATWLSIDPHEGYDLIVAGTAAAPDPEALELVRDAAQQLDELVTRAR